MGTTSRKGPANGSFRAIGAGILLLVAIGLGIFAAGWPAKKGDSQEASPQAPAAPAGPLKAAGIVDREIWEVATIQGARVGYARTTVRRATQNGQELLRAEGMTRLAMRRFDTTITMDIRFASSETLDGKLVDCESAMAQGKTTVTTTGRVKGSELLLKLSTNGKTTSVALPWPPDGGGYYALQQSLVRKPMKPGETRTIHALEPGTTAISTTRLVARSVEPVKLLDKTSELLHVDTTTTLDNQAIKGALWTDREGEIWKTRAEILSMELFRTTKEEALKASEPGKLDVATSVSIPVDRPLERPHETKRVRYRVTLEGGNPAEAFVSCPSQQVRSVGPTTAEVTVFALRPGGPAGNPDAKPDPPTADDREANNWIQSDHPKIVAAAKEAAGDLKDSWQVAVALERYARSRIRRPGFSQAFDTALDVLESGEGDCTEHAVLLAALARARGGIPARVAIGLVYSQQSFLYHMWTEMYLQGRWIAMDATLAQGGIGAAHLKLVHTSLHGATALSSFLPVAQVAGRLKIEILDVE